jgi:CubicO group peptidase (beta-lactamase class C family)
MDDGLETGAIDTTLFGADQAAKLDTFFKALYKGKFGEVHGILLVHRGKLVLEEYFPGFRFNGGKTGFTADDTHHLASVTKSLTSLCVGIAVDKGYIKSIDQPFLDYYPDQVPDRKTKESITIRHLLTITAGLEWDESTFPYTDLRNDIVRFYISADPLQFLLDRKVAVPPGTQWKYCGACPNLLGDIIYRSSGYPLDKFAKEFLYAPLGITKGSWITLHKGFIYASGDAELRPRDMAKIGMLVLNGGTWKGKRVVSREWLELSMRAAERADASNMYGFLWWLPIIPPAAADSLGPVYLASGWGGQYIAVIPKRDLVLVLTGGNYYDLNDPDLVPILAALLNLFS